MTTKSKSLCSGCHNDYYNHTQEGGCWCFEKAQLVERSQVGTWQNPPYKWHLQVTLSCHTAPEGRHWIDENDPRLEQNWKG